MTTPYSALDLTVNIDDRPWEDLKGSPGGTVQRIAGIPLGTAHGNAAVALGVQLDDGTWVIAQTTLRLLHAAVLALGERYKDDLA